MLQLRAAAARAGREWPILHPIELLDRSIRNDVSERRSLG
jgi:hypothetical protein